MWGSHVRGWWECRLRLAELRNGCLPWVCTGGGRAVCCYDMEVPIYKGVWRSHARGWWKCRLQLAAALAVLVGKFAVDDGGGGNLYRDSFVSWVKKFK